MNTEILRKTTGKGAVLIVTTTGERHHLSGVGLLTVTVDGAAADTTLHGYAAPKTVGAKIVVGSIGGIGLTREEYDTIREAIAISPPAPVAPRYEHSKEYTAEDEAFDRGMARRETGE